MNRVTQRWLLALVALVIASVAPASAQVVTTSSIAGIVTTADGEPLPGANVVAVHGPSGTTFGAASRIDGRFNLANLRVGGPYTVTASFAGFRPTQITGVQLSLGQEFDLTIVLEEADLGGEVVVTADATRIINPDRTGAETNFNRDQIESLPTVNRSISDITRLVPQSTGFNSFAGRNNLYNNISIDGSVFNNVFGLASEVGGQTRQQPISLEAVEQIAVSVAPYDVRQGSFTGAGINLITRAGTNEYNGSIYSYFRNQDLVSNSIAGETTEVDRFSERQSGLTIGGPIIQDKAFFFLSGELRDRIDPGATFRAAMTPGETGVDVATPVLQSDLDAIRNALVNGFGYDPGTTGIYDLDNGGTNLTARFDYNINSRHRLNVRFNYLDSFRDTPTSNSNSVDRLRTNGPTSVPFSNINYIINNDVYSGIAQLNSTLGDNIANQFTIGYTALRDSRSSNSDPFPLVDILNGAGSSYTAFGYEQFTPNNLLDTDIYQIANNTSLFMGDHIVTFGTSNEIYGFRNGFTPQFYGYYRFASVQDFLDHVNAPNPAASGVPQPIRYQQTYSAVPGVAVPYAEIDAAQVGLFVQDEWRAMPNLRLTAGLRVDAPIFFSDLPANPSIAGLTYNGGEVLDVSKLPGFAPLWSPRLGFNYDVLDNKQYQLRGGTGIFTGKIPFVWVSNQASNNGVLFGSTFVTGNGTSPLCFPGTGGSGQPACDPITFSGDVTEFVPANAAAPASVTINVTDEDFKFPQVWRSNIAFDAELPGGFIGTLEGIYTKDLNAVFHRDANLVDPIGTYAGPDNRPYFPSSSGARRINNGGNGVPVINNAIVLDNTSDGYQYLLTADLQKTFDAGALDGLFARLAYTRSVSRDLTSSPSAIAFTAWSSNQTIAGPNVSELGYSSFDQPHRILGLAAYRLNYLGLAGTSLSLTYTGGSGFNYSYVYNGDMNSDGINGNDLIYIPASQSEIAISPASGDTRTVDQIWAALDAFIAQDPYLSEHRGQYAERGAARTPWQNRFDLGIRQELAVPVGGGRKTRLELSLDVVNIGNLFNSDWGVAEIATATNPITYRGTTTTNGAVTPQFTFGSASSSPTESFSTNTGLDSRWQALFGVKLGI